MPYAYRNTRGVTYYLHERTITLAGSNKQQTIRYFRKEPNEQAIDTVPEGYEIFEGPRSTLPLLRKRGETMPEGDPDEEAEAGTDAEPGA